ncbi:MAG TPA: NAD(P)-dependent alcohol dehydrogenase [Vicinamibacterales bacterium]|nr:NAD(P)-dependent alcohol dehydrogenase [Vicinamibacterales bacterium]
MRAILQTRYGAPDVLGVREIDRPAVGKNEVLVQVHAASVNPLDWHNVRGLPYFLRMGNGLIAPKNGVPGVDVAGRVEAVGSSTAQVRSGDEVFGLCSGAFAEYACAREDRLVSKPARLTFEQAAAVPVAALTALQGLRDRGRIQRGQKVLIVGASGGVGTFAVQIAKSFGADVTGVCSTRNVDMVRSLGAQRVIDYTQEDFTRSGQRYDLILDMAGTHSLMACRRALTPRGTYVVVGAPSGRWFTGPDRFLRALVLSVFVSQRMVPFVTSATREDLLALKDLIEAGTLKPVIDRSYDLTEVPEAIAYLEQGHARGKVVITVSRPDRPPNSESGG